MADCPAGIHPTVLRRIPMNVLSVIVGRGTGRARHATPNATNRETVGQRFAFVRPTDLTLGSNKPLQLSYDVIEFTVSQLGWAPPTLTIISTPPTWRGNYSLSAGKLPIVNRQHIEKHKVLF